MKTGFFPFGNEVRTLNNTITTATNKQYNLKNKPLIKFILRFIGLPHFGARVRAYYLNHLLSVYACPDGKFLDAGCGIGLNTLLAARAGKQIIGVDTNNEKITLANSMKLALQYTNVTFQTQDITRLAFRDNLFAGAICFEVLEHIPNDDMAIAQIARVLKKDGILFLSVPATGFISKLNMETKHHVREGYSLSEIQKKFGKNNMKIVKILPIEHTPLGLWIRYLNDEIGKRSLALVTLAFPFFFPLGILDGIFPSIVKSNNWIFVLKKL